MTPPTRQDVAHARLDAPLRTFVGLAVVWGCLSLVFLAHLRSDAFVRLESFDTAHGDRSAMAGVAPSLMLRWPFSMHMWETSRRQAIQNLAAYVGLEVDTERLTLLDDAPRAIRFDHEPLYQAIHSLIDQPSTGFGIRERELIVFEQTLDSASGLQSSMDWQAELTLSDQPALIVPSGEADLWFSVRLIGSRFETPVNLHQIEVEIRRDGEVVNVARSALSDHGMAQLTLSGADELIFSAQRLETEEGTDENRYRLRLYHRNHQ